MSNKYKELKLLGEIFSRKLLLIFCGLFGVFSCGRNEIQRNPYLLEPKIQYELNLSLPLYNALTFVGGSYKVQGIGLNGVILFNLNGSTYLAWEASCPNHDLKSCSELEIEGVLAVCSCEAFQYSLATGQILNPTEDLQPPQGMLFYQVTRYNNTLQIVN